MKLEGKKAYEQGGWDTLLGLCVWMTMYVGSGACASAAAGLGMTTMEELGFFWKGGQGAGTSKYEW